MGMGKASWESGFLFGRPLVAHDLASIRYRCRYRPRPRSCFPNLRISKEGLNLDHPIAWSKWPLRFCASARGSPVPDGAVRLGGAAASGPFSFWICASGAIPPEWVYAISGNSDIGLGQPWELKGGALERGRWFSGLARRRTF